MLRERKMKKRIIVIALAGVCFSVQAHSAWYSTTIDMNSYVANGMNYSTSIDLADYLPSSSSMRTTKEYQVINNKGEYK